MREKHIIGEFRGFFEGGQKSRDPFEKPRDPYFSIITEIHIRLVVVFIRKHKDT